MAQVLIVVYELHDKSADTYEKIVKIIEQYDFLKIGGSEYCIYTDDTPQIVFNKLQPYINGKDRALTIKITNPCWGWLSQEQWNWLNDRLQRAY